MMWVTILKSCQLLFFSGISCDPVAPSYLSAALPYGIHCLQKRRWKPNRENAHPAFKPLHVLRKVRPAFLASETSPKLEGSEEIIEHSRTLGWALRLYFATCL